MKRLYKWFMVLMIGSILVACGSTAKPVGSTSPKTDEPSFSNPGLKTTDVQSAPAQQAKSVDPQDINREDTQGAVTVVVKPDNLSNPGQELVFEVNMNTHSVDLSMDLAALATLTTDNGKAVRASSWKAPNGGHHVSGTLTFPGNVDGKSILDGARKLTLTITNVDAPERIFIWDLNY